MGLNWWENKQYRQAKHPPWQLWSPTQSCALTLTASGTWVICDLMGGGAEATPRCSGLLVKIFFFQLLNMFFDIIIILITRKSIFLILICYLPSPSTVLSIPFSFLVTGSLSPSLSLPSLPPSLPPSPHPPLPLPLSLSLSLSPSPPSPSPSPPSPPPPPLSLPLSLSLSQSIILSLSLSQPIIPSSQNRNCNNAAYWRTLTTHLNFPWISIFVIAVSITVTALTQYYLLGG